MTTKARKPGPTATELSDAARVNLLPLPARNERGEICYLPCLEGLSVVHQLTLYNAASRVTARVQPSFGLAPTGPIKTHFAP